MIRNRAAACLGLVALGTVACSEVSPTGVDESLLPDEPVTVEVRLAWDEFGSGLAVFGGFGTAYELGAGVTAHAYGGSLEARTLVRLPRVPTSAFVRDTTGTQRTDTTLQILGGRIIAIMDTVATAADGPVDLEVGMVNQTWDVVTATWESAVDSVDSDTAWEEPGGGPVSNVVSTTWDPSAGDSAVFELDSAQVAAWSDTSSANQGLRLAAVSEGVRLGVNDILLQVDTRPSSNPDTTLVLVVDRQSMTFVYSPSPPPPDGTLRVGGTPSWRTVLDVVIPPPITEPSPLCGVVACPVTLTADNLNYAALVLRTRRTDPAFAPNDSVRVDIRPVYDRSTLPKSPLGSSLITTSNGKRFGPELFSDAEDTEVEIPITSFLRALLRQDSTAGLPPPHTLALLSTFEPASIAYASFFGPGTTQEPLLRLVVTVARPVELP